jgi:molecular chaperone DnaK (HSP70)
MRLGIDFGTTHTVVALLDRGNYPVVAFEETGSALPSIAAAGPDGTLRYGAEAAEAAREPGWRLLRSFKRLLAGAGPLSSIEGVSVSDLLEGYFRHVRDQLLHASNAQARRGERLEAAVSVPANASNDQRFLTIDAFRRAGFEVPALLNEPSAAGFEYAHRFRGTLTSRREYVLVYDLGGGTFDCSLIHMAGRRNEVVTSGGVRRLGGDDIDEAILDLALAKAGLGEDLIERGDAAPRPPEPPALASGVDPAARAAAVRAALLEECRRQKENIGANTRRLVIDLEVVGRPPLVVPMDEVNEACGPLVERTIESAEEVMSDPRGEDDEPVGWNEVAGIYVVGGASGFPLVYRRLRERFGNHRVRRSPHPFAATAIGLACYLDSEAGYELADRLTRHFGVWREAEAGSEVSFDRIFPKDTPLPAPGQRPVEAVRRYRAAHNVGHFRFVECGRIRDGHPDGALTPWEEIRFPFEPELREADRLESVPVMRLGSGPEVEERYRCASDGTLEVTLSLPKEGFSRTYTIVRRAEDLTESRPIGR